MHTILADRNLYPLGDLIGNSNQINKFFMEVEFEKYSR